ncbi:MAG: thiamine-phosphate kinase [Stenotrophobium sp.]
MDEFSLIRQYFADLTPARHDVLLGIGDDCALLDVPAGCELAITTDTLVSGRHFPESTAPADIGWKSLAVNLSDIAAMGAQARWFTLALTLPSADAQWLEAFASGLRKLAVISGVALIGGDTTRGPLSITITALGTVSKGQALKRTGAQAGDAICVTGTLGDAALALRQIAEPGLTPYLLTRLNRPTPRLSAGLALRDLAHAAIDLSDGLAGDLAHVLRASCVGAVIVAGRLPSSADFVALAPEDQRLSLQIQGGDDYELCVCMPHEAVAVAATRLDVPLTVIGHVTAEPDLRWVDANGANIALSPQGYLHFP